MMDIGLLFFGVLFPIMSLVGVILLRKAWSLGLSSVNWPSTKGLIIESRFEPDDDSYNLIVEYEYNIDGAKIRGNNYTYRGFSTDLASVERIVARYPVGKCVLVYFDPIDVNLSVLVPGVNRNAYIAASIVLFVFFVVGISCLGYTVWSFTSGRITM
jgi:hypothetical protein